MFSWNDRFNQLRGQTRLVVSRIFVHLTGKEVTPLLGTLNAAAREAVESNGDLHTVGEGLVSVCQSLLQAEPYWYSAANEGDVFWHEGEANSYATELFTDSAQRYLDEPSLTSSHSNFSQTTAKEDSWLSIPLTENLVVMLVVAYEGKVPELETDLSQLHTLRQALKSLINLHYDDRLRAIQIHFSPAQLGETLTSEQIMQFFPELMPL